MLYICTVLLLYTLLKLQIMENLTGAEKVLYKAHYEFALLTLKMSEEDAAKQAEAKVKQKRKLAKNLRTH